jgi:glycerol 3-phosphatase-2
VEPSPERGMALGASERPLCEAYDAALLDLDGVLYVGSAGVRHAAASVAAARAAGMALAYVTNNASRRPAAVAAHLTELGIPAEPGDVVTSGQAAVRVLTERLPVGSAVLVVGSDGLADEVAAGGFRPVRTIEQAGTAGPTAVVQGLSTDTSWRDLAEAALAIRAGALWVTGNTDSTLPSPRGPLPGNGSLVAALRAATGAQPLVAGKPEPALHLESVARVGSRRPLVVGDRLDTDVLGAVRGGADSLLVLTGVADRAAVLAAPPGSRPTYVARDLRGLLAAHPGVVVDGAQARCRAARAACDGDVLRLSGEDDDALRAGCALAWARADEGRPVDEVHVSPS